MARSTARRSEPLGISRLSLGHTHPFSFSVFRSLLYDSHGGVPISKQATREVDIYPESMHLILPYLSCIYESHVCSILPSYHISINSQSQSICLYDESLPSVLCCNDKVSSERRCPRFIDYRSTSPPLVHALIGILSMCMFPGTWEMGHHRDIGRTSLQSRPDRTIGSIRL